VAAAAVTGCSSNAGFGTPPPIGSEPQGNATNPPMVSPQPFVSPTPQPTPTPATPLQVDSASARLAYDASAADPVKAPRLVEVTFALNNPGATPMPISNVAIAADSNPPANVGLSLQALGNQDTTETLVAVAPPKDPSKVRQLTLNFTGGKNVLLATSTIDFPGNSDFVAIPLEKSQPAGGLSVDDISITYISAPGKGPHYDLTFAVTNAGTAKQSIAFFTVAPPKGEAVKLAIPIVLPARTQTAPVSVVVPYAGKSLPSGKYTVTASDGTNSLASGTGPLL